MDLLLALQDISPYKFPPAVCMDSILVCFSVAVIKLGEKRVFFSLQVIVQQ